MTRHQRRKALGRGNRGQEPAPDSNRDDEQAVPQEQSQDLFAGRDERHAHADFLPALAHVLPDDTVESDCGDEHGGGGEDREHDGGNEPPAAHRPHQLVDHAVVEDRH